MTANERHTACVLALVLKNVSRRIEGLGEALERPNVDVLMTEAQTTIAKLEEALNECRKANHEAHKVVADAR